MRLIKTMIDTIKFRIKVTKDLYFRVLACSGRNLETKLPDGKYLVRFHNIDVHIPSSDRNVNLIQYPNNSTDHVFIEFSVPKQIYGTNIVIPNREQMKHAIDEVYKVIKSMFDDFPDISEWLVVRIDLPVMWRYGSLDEARTVLNVIKNFGEKIFDTTVYNGNSVFYLKHPEFMKHDYKALAYKDLDVAINYSKLCEPYLRYEVRLRNKSVYTNLGGYGWNSIINQPDSMFRDVVERHLLKFFKGCKLEVMTDTEAVTLLISRYGLSPGMKLWSYLAIRDGNMKGKETILNKLSKQDRSKWNKQIKSVGIGISAKSQVHFPDMNSTYLVMPNVQAL